MKEEIKEILHSDKKFKDKLKDLLKYAESGKLAPFVQFVKFGLVGVSNTAIHYGGKQLGYYVLFAAIPNDKVKIILGTTLGFIASVINSYFWNNKYVFKSEGKKTFGEHAKAFLKMTSSYALSNLLLATLLEFWLRGLGIPYWLASLLTLVVTVPLNFFMNKLWVFRKKKEIAADEAETEGEEE